MMSVRVQIRLNCQSKNVLFLVGMKIKYKNVLFVMLKHTIEIKWAIYGTTMFVWYVTWLEWSTMTLNLFVAIINSFKN